MIRHLIVFNLREGATHDDCLEAIAVGRQQLMKIPGVKGVSFGESMHANARYRYTLAVDFENEDIIELYQNHPIHVEYANRWFRPLAVDRITTDYRILF